MATSPIYSWPEPDNTDLVKNGALAIRTLGNAIDTTMATMVPKSIVDAKGDLIAGTAADTAARLAVGNNGETLVADSSTATGLRYQTGVNLNGVINGGFDIWQRNTSVTFASSATTTYNAADRWAFSHSGTSASTTISRQTATNNGSQYALRLQRVSGQTTTPYYFLYNVLETSDTAKFAGKTVTLSVWVKAGANYSGGSSAYMQIRTGTGTDQSAQSMIDGTWTGYASNSQGFTPTTTSTRYTYTLTLGSTVTQLGINLGYLTSGTAGANDWLEFEQVQLEVGSVATNFKRAGGGTLQGELAACQRYYYLHSTGSGKGVALGTYYSGSDMRAYVGLPVTMRTTPTLSAGSGTNYYRIISGGVSTDYFNSFTLEAGYAQTAIIQNSTEVSGTAGYAGIVSCESGTSSFVAFSAEL